MLTGANWFLWITSTDAEASASLEKYLIDSRASVDDRFPTPAIFPKY